MIFEQSPDFCVFLDMDGTILEANTAALDIGGLAGRQVCGVPFWSVAWWQYDEETRVGLKNAIRLASDGETIRYEVNAFDGEKTRPLDLSIKPIVDDSGARKNILIVGRDITDRRWAEEALKRKSAELELIFNNVPVGLTFKDDQNRLVRINETSARLLGMPVEEVEGKSGYELFPEVAAASHEDDLEIIRSGKPKLNIVSKFSPPGRKPVWFRYDKTPYVDPGTGRNYVFISAHDITVMMEAEEARRVSEDRYKKLYDNTPVMLHSIDAEGRILSANNYWLERMGYELDEVVGRHVTEFHTPESAKFATDTAIPEFLRSGSSNNIEFQLVTKSGEVMDVLVSAAADLNETGEIASTMAVQIDVTERKAVERQLVQAQKMETVGQLTGGLAHDFNNLLSVVLGNLQLMEPFIEGNEIAEKRIRAAMFAVERGAELTRRLLAFARRQQLETESLDPNPLITNMVEMLERTLGESVELKCELGEDVPNVWTDPSQLESAIINLAINARDAMPEGGTLTIKSGVEFLGQGDVTRARDLRPGNYAVISVSDTGVGIPADEMGKVFEPFFTTKETGKGSGLGLSMVYGFLKQLGGDVRISGVVEQGTTVELFLPIDDSGSSKKGDLRKESGAEFDGTGVTVLVVEDQDDVRDVAVALLQSLKCTVIEASNGREGIETLKKNNDIDMLFTDIVMPGELDGVALAELAADLRPELPILFTTGFADSPSIQSGSVDVTKNLIFKPYRRAALASAIIEILAK